MTPLKTAKVFCGKQDTTLSVRRRNKKMQVLFFTMILTWKALMFSVSYTFIRITVLPFMKCSNVVSIK